MLVNIWILLYYINLTKCINFIIASYNNANLSVGCDFHATKGQILRASSIRISYKFGV